jgi:uncharacterized protein DUF1353
MTPEFLTGNPRVDFLPDGINVILRSDIVFRDSTGRIWIANDGKRSDGASIPQILWPWLGGPYNGFHRDGALLHDDAGYLFAPATEATYWAALWSKERAAADRMIWEATVVRIQQACDPKIVEHPLTVPRKSHEYAKANAIYQGLRFGGWKAWADHARENERVHKGIEVSRAKRNGDRSRS